MGETLPNRLKNGSDGRFEELLDAILEQPLRQESVYRVHWQPLDSSTGNAETADIFHIQAPAFLVGCSLVDRYHDFLSDRHCPVACCFKQAGALQIVESNMGVQHCLGNGYPATSAV